MVKIMGPNPKTKKTTFLDVWVYYVGIWVFPRIGVPQNGWFIMETPIKMDDLGVALFLETPISNKKIRQVSPGLCVSWWAKDRDGWVFYLLNGEQRIATRWGLSTSQCIVIVFNWLVFFPGPNGNEMEGGVFEKLLPLKSWDFESKPGWFVFSGKGIGGRYHVRWNLLRERNQYLPQVLFLKVISGGNGC